jgi:hypothetical protein
MLHGFKAAESFMTMKKNSHDLLRDDAINLRVLKILQSK